MITRKHFRSLFFSAILGLAPALLPVPAKADITSDSSLDDTDQQARHDALDQILAAAPGAEQTWSNINSGHRGAFKSMSERPSEGGQTCRDIAETVWFQDGQESGTLVACRAGSDPWRVVSSNLKPDIPAPPDAAAVSQPPGLGNLPVQVWVGAPRIGNGATVAVPSASGAP